ncbi:MAG: AbrB/MazE/SpoVT family DNA-binding domain-containing protein [Anaerolineae bacterium]|nr:AbrB/MazE/SpoVT family DNA-binding domain-containing protein [Anaerolineae bacterium]
MLARLSSKGQLVIPKSMREALGLRSGDQVHVMLERGKIILEPQVVSVVDALYGKYADADFLAELEEEHRHEVHHDAALRA